MSSDEAFEYPALPLGRDAIRILTLKPGDFYGPIDCSLEPVAFVDNPQYAALSYTWGHPFSDGVLLPTSPSNDGPGVRSLRTAVSPRHESFTSRPKVISQPSTTQSMIEDVADPLTEISVDGRPFFVRPNLIIALRHLRSSTHSLRLWVDALCIDQANTAERNAQVALMAFIYARAQLVIAWLGPSVDGRRAQLDAFHYMATDWKMGRARYLAESAVSYHGSVPLRRSPPPDAGNFARAIRSAYWSRLWIVQEACIPRVLVFVYGSQVWTDEDLSRWQIQMTPEKRSTVQSGALVQVDPGHHDDAAEPMQRLLKARSERHSDAMTLERLIETFSTQKCSELRDRIYGLLGLANDVSSDSSGRTHHSQPDGQHLIHKSPRGIQIDYSSSLFELWADAVNHLLHAPEPRFDETGITEALEGKSAFPGTVAPQSLKRRVTITRTASILQEALGQGVEKEVAGYSVLEGGPGATNVMILGYLSAVILQVGPSYNSILGSYEATQDWTASWRCHYLDPADLQTLRRVNEEYWVRVTRYEETERARIQSLGKSNAIAWRMTHPEPFKELEGLAPLRNRSNFGLGVGSEEKAPDEPVFFLGTRHQIGTVPANARADDVIVRFWNCDTALLMRPLTRHEGDDIDGHTVFQLIGRADVAGPAGQDDASVSRRDTHAEEAMPGQGATQGQLDGVWVRVDLKTLQTITASIKA